MTPLLKQFVAEARELLDAAVEGLLALERTPAAADVIADVFRSVHTLKGNAGFFEFAAISVAVHSAEDLLDAVRDGRLGIDPAMVDDLLKLCDLVGEWVDEITEQGRLAESHLEAASACAVRLRRHLPADLATASIDVVHGPGVEEAGPQLDWLKDVEPRARERLRADARARGHERLVIGTYAPAADCFFSGDDPCLTLLSLPGLLASEIEFVPLEGPVETFDPYHCRLRLHFACAATHDEVSGRLQFVREQVSLCEQPLSWLDAPAVALAPGLETAFLKIVQAQIASLAVLLADRQGAVVGVEDPRVLSMRRVITQALSVLNDAARSQEWERVWQEAQGGADVALVTTLLGEWAVPPPRPVVPESVATESAHLPLPAESPPAELPAAAEPRVAREDAAVSEGGARSASMPATVRVEQEKLDRLMDLIGELVVAKNGLPYLAKRAMDTYGNSELAREIKDRHGVLNRISQELQDAIMQVRMMPVSQVLQRFPRVVRDLARRLGKEVELHLSGEQTEADKNVIEAMADPLVHLLRNAVDHGIEAPQQRRDAGKPATGSVHVRAWQDSDQVCIEIADDGAGIDPARVRSKALEKGLISAEEANALDDEQAVQLIFAAGFSTAEQISDVSGRGVGMDVVRTSVERLGGRVSLSSRLGQGSCVQLSLPLSMAVSNVMAFQVGSQRFGIAMDKVMETLRVSRDRIFSIKQQEAIVLRDRVVPLHRMSHLLELPGAPESEDGELAVLVVRTLGEPVGFVIDAFDVGIETIVKPMEGLLSGLQALNGTALLGDGSVLLVVDPGALL